MIRRWSSSKNRNNDISPTLSFFMHLLGLEMIHWETSRTDQIAMYILSGFAKGTIYLALKIISTIVKFLISSPLSSVLGITVLFIVNKLNNRNKGGKAVDVSVGGDDFYDANEED